VLRRIEGGGRTSRKRRKGNDEEREGRRGKEGEEKEKKGSASRNLKETAGNPWPFFQLCEILVRGNVGHKANVKKRKSEREGRNPLTFTRNETVDKSRSNTLPYNFSQGTKEEMGQEGKWEKKEGKEMGKEGKETETYMPKSPKHSQELGGFFIMTAIKQIGRLGGCRVWNGGKKGIIGWKEKVCQRRGPMRRTSKGLFFFKTMCSKLWWGK